MRRLILISLLALGACVDIPRDPERTEALVRETGVIRLGWVAGAESDAAAEQALARLADMTGARIERHEGQTEMVLSDLADGKLDLAYGHFARSNPWAREVHLGSALGWRSAAPKREPVPRFAMRNGENGWVMLVEKASQP